MTKSNKRTQRDLLNGSVSQTLKQMTIPMTYGMVLLMTFNLVDTFFVGMLGTAPLAAISFTFPITFTVISMAIGLGIGTSAVIAKTLGKGNKDDACNAATVALMVSSVIVIILSALGYLYSAEIFTLLGAEQKLLPLIHQYMDLWFLGSIGLVAPMIGNAILRASGDTHTPSIIMGSAGLINAVLDPVFIFGFGPVPAMGIQGAAIATLISWAFGLVFITYILGIKRKLIHMNLPPWSVIRNSTRQILKIGLPAAGANMLTPIAAAVMTAIAATYGESTVAAFGVGSRIESIASLVVLALSMTLPPFISQNFGAEKLSRVEEGYKVSVRFVLMWQLGVYLALLLIAPYIAAAFTNEQEVADLIKLFIYILPLGYGLQGIIILTNSSFNALHKPMIALVLSVLRLFVFYVPLAYVGSLLFDIEGFFIGAVIGNFFMAVVSYQLFKRQFKCPQKLVSA
ncbi:MATE family efflux transporter [Thalassotalea sp. HSM 43]|uniref:MATE family efflux transporter n=1 Tax=Thalassotalea sp. HSM 43 TaxID=2552945 RepID=UPI0010803A85|nr:MATE family efflux transporter [Thalassotalea sp. HSM 43]QBY05888.1 MATE family efflux transporter [Thalassotalea sp. HSM 43]